MENAVLYRKYRPKKFSEIVGQGHIVRTLQNALLSDKVSHAYLFTGPRGTGKTTTARLLAKALNCKNLAKREPCNKCEYCLEVNEGRTLDLIEIDAASNRGIDEIRNLKESVRFGATKGDFKVYLVDEVHMLTKEAFNAFLKTLEEPPTDVVFVLATTEPNRLPATVVSRTQRFDFRRLTLDEMAKRLKTVLKAEKAQADERAIKMIALEADGSMRDAESLLGQLITFGNKKITVKTIEEVLGIVSHTHLAEFVDTILKKDHSSALSWVASTTDAGYDLHQLAHSLNHYFRRMLLVTLDEKLAEKVKSEVGEDVFKKIKDQAEKTNPEQLTRLIERFSRARWELERYPIPQMAIEMALAEIFLTENPKAT